MTVSLPLSRPAPVPIQNPRCQWHHGLLGNTLLRIQTTPVERKSHARTVHDQATAGSLSLIINEPGDEGNYLRLRQYPANWSQSWPFLAQTVSIQTINISSEEPTCVV